MLTQNLQAPIPQRPHTPEGAVTHLNIIYNLASPRATPYSKTELKMMAQYAARVIEKEEEVKMATLLNEINQYQKALEYYTKYTLFIQELILAYKGETHPEGKQAKLLDLNKNLETFLTTIKKSFPLDS